MRKPYTDKQGQYLAFIYYYTKMNGRAPAEADMKEYFGVTPPSVHQMVLTLEANGLIERTPGMGRSIRLLIAREQLPGSRDSAAQAKQLHSVFARRWFPARHLPNRRQKPG